MAKQLSSDQRGRVAEKIMDWGNLVFVGLVISQAFTGSALALGRALVGIVTVAGAYWFAIWLMKGGGD